MRRVVDSREVFHLWAHQAQDEAHNSSRSVSFQTDSAYSYRAKIARHVTARTGERAVLFSSHKWSVTTAKHQTYCRSSIPDGVRVFTVPELDEGFAQPQHLANLRHYTREVAEAQGKAKRARKYGAYHTERALELQQEANAYCRFFGIAEAFDSETLRVATEAHEAERARVAAEERERARVRAEEMRIEYADAASAWISGDTGARLPYDYPDVLLRVEAEEVVTTKGARVPVQDAERLYRLLKAGALKRGDEAGSYAVSRVEAEAVQIGCHYIKFAEVERFATAQGWNAAPVEA